MKLYAVNPTNEFYGQLQYAYDHFNKDLFEGQLPPCLITVQREKNTTGYFSPSRWSNREGSQAHEIALHPGYFIDRQLIEVFQTLVHEQCHLWQHEFGRPSRTGYHNQEWAAKMISIGLIPSSTGLLGGKSVGQKMSDYPDENGAFKNSCLKLTSNGFHFKWADRRVAKSQGEYIDAVNSREKKRQTSEDILYLRIAKTFSNFAYLPKPEGAKLKVKVKYHCSSCGANVWGKPELNIRCEECKNLFTAELG
jgi:predicted SprT family Zn-dependent metalloprotease